jgi:hypothetical protein
VGNQDRTKELYYVLLMVMTGGILGAFASLDVFFLYFVPRVGPGSDLHHDWGVGAR